MRRRESSKSKRRKAAKSPGAAWREQPATEAQWKVLRKIGREQGRVFPLNITRGEASVWIAKRFDADPVLRKRSRARDREYWKKAA